MKPLLLVLLALFLVSPSASFGQGNEPLPETEVQKTLSTLQLKELEKWMKDDQKYLKWYKLYGNRSRFKQRKRPTPPEWLASECQDLIGGEGLLVKACALLKKIQEGDLLTKTRKTIEEARVQKEAPVNTKWFERFHVGTFDPIVSNFKQSKYGAIIEFHYSIVDIGRFEINLPGYMLLSLPDRSGRRVVKRATSFGASMKLKTFVFPGTKQKVMSHLNFMNARVHDDYGSLADNETLSLMGFSFTLKK